MLKNMMKQRYKKHILLFLLVFSAASSFAQLKGVITDSITHEPLMYISVYYEGKGVGGVSNANGEYQIETRKGWNEVTFSSVGYRTKVIKSIECTDGSGRCDVDGSGCKTQEREIFEKE